MYKISGHSNPLNNLKVLPKGITLELLYKISGQSIWFLIWILKQNGFWKDLIKEVLEEPFVVERFYFHISFDQIYYLRINKNNRVHGISRAWHKNGQLEAEFHWKDEKRHGICRHWYENGQLGIEYYWKDGQQYGIEREWYKNGQIWKESHCKDGKKVSQKIDN